MRLFRKIQKITLVSFLIFEFFVTSAFPVSAGLFSGSGIKIPSASNVASELERRYNLDLGSIQNQGQVFNVADTKKLVPEVSLFFSPSDPKEGQKITAKAFPIYFSNTEESLYYTWFLKRSGCDLTNSPSAAKRDLCDSDHNGGVTVEDWKVEASRILAQNGYEGPPSAGSEDDDGYHARFGGDTKVNTPDYCYIHDVQSGTNYELLDTSDTSFACPAGTSPVCMVGEGQVDPETLNITADADSGGGTASSSGAGDVFSVGDTNVCYLSGLPACSSGTPLCNVGAPRCVADPTTTTSCGTALVGCSTGSSGSSCSKHLFPDATSGRSGDGLFGTREENFWGTDPNDPDTADNGNKDEANVIGLGRSSFTWNYVAGDEVGVVVEGTSLIPTKHDDSSAMIMWAFSKNDCPVESTGAYTELIKGYLVTIPTADLNLNKCIERNLVDPTRGGQATNMEVTVSATPENPLNDETSDKGGDSIIVEASIANPQGSLSTMLFDWDVDISDNIQFRSGNGDDTADVTEDLQRLRLLGNVKGSALNSINVKLDIPRTATLGGRPFASYLSGGIGYLRFKARVTENFSSRFTRKGRSDVIVKFTSSGKKIGAYKAGTTLAGNTMKVSLPADAEAICNKDVLDRTACRVVQNEIIGLKIDDAGLSNFKWTINGSPLTCSRTNVSNDCADEPGAVNFFPVVGNVGDVYTVSVTANDVSNAEGAANTGNVVTLSRSFHIVQPLVVLQSLDMNTAWQKYLGQYRDITGQATEHCPGGWCSDRSTSMFEGFSGSTLAFRAEFIPDIPDFLGGDASVREWRVDGEPISETAAGEIAFSADKPAPGVYTINLIAEVLQSNDTRRALLDIWGVSPFESTEINLAATAQVVLQEPGSAKGPFQGERKYLAALISYIPASVLFTFRILLSAVLLLFTTHFLLSLLQERRIKTFVSNNSQYEK